jgi:plastocyanin
VRTRVYLVAVSAAALLGVSAGCGSPSGAANPAAPSTAMAGMPTTAPPANAASGANSRAPVPADTVSIANFAFVPATVTVKVGTIVTWTNHDQEAHDVTATGGQFRSSALNTGDRFMFRFTKPGRYGYLCTIHPFMTATVVVTP